MGGWLRNSAGRSRLDQAFTAEGGVAYHAAAAVRERRTLNQAAYSAGRNSRVRTVATVSPPMMATAIGPQKLLRVSGIIARIAAAAVSRIGRKRRTVDSITASHGEWPACRS